MEQNYFDLFLQGGFIIYILLFLSLISLAIILERLVYIYREKSKLKNLLTAFINDNSTEIQSEDSLTGKVLAGIREVRENDGYNFEKVYSLIDDNFKRRTHVLIFIVQLAPLLGILGTVLGLSDAFLSIGQLGGGEKFQFLALGVGKALSTTIAGLIIAAYTMSGHYFIRYLASSTLNLLEPKFDEIIKSVRHKNEE